MEDLGWASLEVIPSVKGFEGKLSAQTAPALDRAGSKGGLIFGNSAGKSMSKGFLTHAKAAALGAGAILGGVAAIGIKFGKDSLQGYEDHLRVVGITKSAIKATGGAANITAKQVGNLTDKLEAQTGVDGDLIQQGANMLLTFKNVRNEQGKGNDIFNQSVSVLNDMSTAMGTDAKSSAIQLGKALNDPLKGITALSRVGVTFDDQQKKQIANFVQQGKSAQAQKIILKELSSEFGGAAKAQETMGDRVLVAYHALQDEVGQALLPVVRDFERFLATKGIPAAEDLFAAFEKKGIPRIKEFVRESKPLVNSILPAAKTGFDDVAGFLKDAAPYAKKTIDAFNSLPDWAQKAVVLGTAGGILAKKTGVLGFSAKALTGGGAGSGGILGLVSKAKPLPVFVTNPEFLGGPNGKTPPVVGTGAKGAAGAASAEAEAVKAAKLAADAVKAAGGDVAAQSSAAARAFKEAMAAHDAAVLKNVLDFGIKGGIRGVLGTVLAAPASITLGDAGNEQKQLGQLQLTLKDFKKSVAEGKITRADLGNSALLAAFNVTPVQARRALGILKATSTGADSLKQHLKQASDGLDLVSHRGSSTFKGLSGDTDNFGEKIKGATTRTDVLENRLRRFPKRLVSELDLDTRQAERKIAAIRASAGRHINAELSIELAGRGPRQAALDGVRR